MTDFALNWNNWLALVLIAIPCILFTFIYARIKTALKPISRILVGIQFIGFVLGVLSLIFIYTDGKSDQLIGKYAPKMNFWLVSILVVSGAILQVIVAYFGQPIRLAINKWIKQLNKSRRQAEKQAKKRTRQSSVHPTRSK